MALVAVSSGCGKSTYDIAPVRGTVTIDGRPFTQGKVQFAPKSAAGEPNAGKPAFGLLQPDGSFVLGTYGESDGAVIGTHSVTIISLADESSPLPAGMPTFSRVLVPRQVAVEAGKENVIPIEITLAELRKYRQVD
jgi:hypothetical protein